MFRKDRFKPHSPGTGLALLGMLIAFCANSSFASAATVFCELAALPALPVEALPLASDLSERLSSEELLSRVAESYRGLLEFGGESLVARVGANSADAEFASPEKFFEPVTGRDQRSVALNESLVKLGDWVMLEAEDHGLTQDMILARLRETIRDHLREADQEQERVEEVRVDRRETGRETETGYIFYPDTRFPELGQAWRDPSGMIWGDVVRTVGKFSRRIVPHNMTHADALKYCQSIGAELPSVEDFIRLRGYMGAQPESHEGYRAQILSDLGKANFWSLSGHPNDSLLAYHFWGDLGVIKDDFRANHSSVRCVRRP